MIPIERFFDRLPLAADIGSLGGVLVVKATGLKAVGLLGSRFNTGFHADYLGKYIGAAVGAAVLSVMCATQKEDTQ